jgi:hypothetical protein
LNDITTLRDALFATLRGLQDRDNPIETDRAKAINETAQTIINSAKLEIDYMRVNGAGRGTNFIPTILEPQKPSEQIEEEDEITRTSSGMKIVRGNVTRHVMR